MKVLPLILIFILIGNLTAGTVDVYLHAEKQSCHIGTIDKLDCEEEAKQMMQKKSCCEKPSKAEDTEQNGCCGDDCDCTCCHHHFSQVIKLQEAVNLQESRHWAVMTLSFYYKDILGILHKYSDINPPKLF